MPKSVQDLIAAEQEIVKLWEAGDLPYLIHLSGGNEHYLINIFSKAQPGDYFFGTHRSHYHYLLAGAPASELIEKVKRGDSMFLYSKQHNFVSSAIVAGTCCIAAGVALSFQRRGLPNRVWCFVGDGAEDEGHFYEAVKFVDGKNLPCTFVIEDNDTSVETPSVLRHNNRFYWPSCVQRYHYKPTYPHAGSGCKTKIVFKPIV